MEDITITSFYTAIFVIVLLPISMCVGFRRVATQTWFLDGGDEVLLRRIRSHSNFLEYVPIALFLMVLVELGGASSVYMHAMGGTLLISRLMHYLTININPTAITRAISMFGTFIALMMGAGWILWGQLVDIFFQ